MRANQRSAVAFLRDTYGIAARVEHKGTKHPRLKFTHKGKEHCISIAGSPSDSYRGPRNMEKQLRDILGVPPPPPPAREPRRLEAMLSVSPGPGPIVAAPAAADIILRGGMALYADKRLRFVLPDEVAAFIGDRAVAISWPTAYGWKLIPLEDRKSRKPRVRRDGKQHTLNGQYAGDALRPFGADSPADYLIGNGEVEVDLRVDQLTAVRDRSRPAPVHRIAPPARPAEPPARPAEPPARPAEPGITWVPSMLDVLRAVEAHERDTPYRLTRLAGGRLEWRAPTIKLED